MPQLTMYLKLEESKAKELPYIFSVQLSGQVVNLSLVQNPYHTHFIQIMINIPDFKMHMHTFMMKLYKVCGLFINE